jgi:hypothetical protein
MAAEAVTDGEMDELPDADTLAVADDTVEKEATPERVAHAVTERVNDDTCVTDALPFVALAVPTRFDGDTVTLSSTGGIDGMSNGSTADITSGTVVLASTGGDVTATVKANSVTASALGVDADTGLQSDVDLRLIGTKSVFLGTPSGVTLAAAGDVTLRTGSNNIVVVATPSAGTGETIDLNTSGMVTFVPPKSE